MTDRQTDRTTKGQTGRQADASADSCATDKLFNQAHQEKPALQRSACTRSTAAFSTTDTLPARCLLTMFQSQMDNLRGQNLISDC